MDRWTPGSHVGDLERRTNGNFKGHEREVWGFPVAYGHGLECITPFDYQGDDGAWIWMEIVDGIWMERRGSDRPDSGPPGLAEIRYNQSPEHTSDTRYMYDEVFPRISLDGLGQRMVDNWMLRNRRMTDSVEQDGERMDSKRVMILVGESHRPFLIVPIRKSPVLGGLHHRYFREASSCSIQGRME